MGDTKTTRQVCVRAQQQKRRQSSAHSSSVSPGTLLSHIRVYFPPKQLRTHCLCSYVGRGSSPHREARYLPLTSLSLQQPTPQSMADKRWRRGGRTRVSWGEKTRLKKKGFRSITKVHVSPFKYVNKKWSQVSKMSSIIHDEKIKEPVLAGQLCVSD